jgi:carotenoid phi-ring synthase / carotenoid chi-ring synthase
MSGGGLFGRLIMRRLGGNRIRVNTVDQTLPRALSQKKTVAVIGAGLAGLTAACTLARRGFVVTVFEKNAYLGGKVGSWPFSAPTVDPGFIDHGFHGFFPQYYNLLRFLDMIGAGPMRTIDDYRILTPNGGGFSFKGIRTTPALNMLSLRKAGLYRLRELVRTPESKHLLSFLSYRGEETFEKYDQMSFQNFCDTARIPASMRVMFNTFSRSFFADADLMSAAEVMKSFHFYFLSNDLGLLYSYPEASYETFLLAPVRAYLEAQGVLVRVGRPVKSLERRDARLHVEGAAFDHVVLAADARSARDIVRASGFLETEDPQTWRAFSRLSHSQGYAVLRAWLSRNVGTGMPPFVAIDRTRLLDSVTLLHHIEPTARAWACARSGSVVELHSYALPRDLGRDEDVAEALLSEMKQFLPEAVDARVVASHLQVRNDFSAYHSGMHPDRPGFLTAVPELVCAGDWVKLPVPAMLMEAACTSALYATNAILGREGLQQEPIESVPLKGLLA